MQRRRNVKVGRRREERTHSTSYQFGVMMVALASAARYIGTTSGATYIFPESPRTAELTHVQPFHNT